MPAEKPCHQSGVRDPGKTMNRARTLAIVALALLLGAFSLFAAAPAAAQTTLWSATLTPRDIGSSVLGCDDDLAGVADNTVCESSGALTDDTFTLGSTNYDIALVRLAGTRFTIFLDKNIPASLKAWTLNVGGVQSVPGSATISAAHEIYWTVTGVTWTAGTAVTLSLTQSSNANLSGLTATQNTSASGTFTTLGIGIFGAATTSYTASVANSVTHVKLTPTKAHTAASIKVGKAGSLSTVTSGSASTAIALAVGANAIKVEVTAQDGTTKDYTVTVTRAGTSTTPTVSLSATPNPVTEGSSVTVTATLSATLSSNVTIPVTLTAGTAESGDFGTLSSITIGSSQTTGTGTITTNQDADEDNETFTVALGSILPSSVTAGSTSSVTVTITDDDGGPRLTLSVPSQTVAEGASVVVTATLDAAAPTGGTTVTLISYGGTAATGDFEFSNAISSNAGEFTIEAGSTSSTGTITIVDDEVGEGDETIEFHASSRNPSLLSDGITLTIPANDGGPPPDNTGGGGTPPDNTDDGGPPPDNTGTPRQPEPEPPGVVQPPTTVDPPIDPDPTDPEPTDPDDPDLPSLSAPETAARSFRESIGDAPTVTAMDIGAPVAAMATDIDEPLQYTLEGADRETFTIVASTGQLRTRAGVVYDHEQRTGYAVVVRASAGETSVTTGVTITVLDAPEAPLAPNVPQVRSDADEDTVLMATWMAPANAGRPVITGYAVRYRAGPGGAWRPGAVNPGELRARLTGLAPETLYQVQVRAMNANGYGPWSGSGEGHTPGMRVSEFMVEGWLVRFGRTVSDQVLEAAGDRFTASQPGFTARLAGLDLMALRAGREALDAASEWPLETGMERSLAWQDALSNASFSYTAETGAGGLASFWGRGAIASFDGEEGDLRLDGEALTGMLGADLVRGPLRAGLILSHADGDGEYRSAMGPGDIDSDMTGLYPWMHRTLNERVSVWGLAGYGEGEIRLRPDGATTLKADTELKMASAGIRGVLQAGETGARPELALVSDGLYVRTESDSIGQELAGTSAELTRVRLGLEGTWQMQLASGAHLNPSVEIGLRHDGGDAETGFGADLATGLAWTDPQRGIRASVQARGLLTHDDSGFRERGLAASLAWDPHPASAAGWSMTLHQAMGASATSGMDALLRPDAASRLAASDDREDTTPNRRLEATLGYGVLHARGQLVGTPHAGLALSDTAREYLMGWRLGLARQEALHFELELHGARQEPLDDDRRPEHLLRLHLGTHW